MVPLGFTFWTIGLSSDKILQEAKMRLSLHVLVHSGKIFLFLVLLLLVLYWFILFYGLFLRWVAI